MNVDGAVTIVTGASGGIGRAIAVALADRNGRVVVVARRADPLGEVAREIVDRGGQAAIVTGDVADEATAAAAVEAANSQFGDVRILVNAAGFGPPKPLLELTKELWDATIESCLTGLYVMTRAVLPAMLANGAGRIVNVSSVAGKGAEANRTAYCAAKWGVEGFSASLRHELAGTGVRLHVLNPASVATDWWASSGDPQPPTVLDRMLAVRDVADALMWILAQPDRVQIDDIGIHNAVNPWNA